MSRNARKMLILAVFCLSGILISIPGFMLRSRSTNITSVKSALLNPKYSSEVNEITLTFETKDNLTFQKQTTGSGEAVWMCTTSDGMMFPANETIINQLISRASETRSMAQISDSYAAWNALGLSDDAAINVKFSCNNPDGSTNIFSSLFFGYENADSTMIYVRNDRKSTSWRIQNVYSSYLTDNCSSWADQRLLPIVSKDEKDAAVTCITVETEEGIRKMYNDDVHADGFDELVHTLLSLRSSELCSPYDFENQPVHPEKILTVTLERNSDSRNTSYGLSIYKAQYTEEPFFFVKNFGINENGEGQYYQVISTWTYNKIAEALSTTGW